MNADRAQPYLIVVSGPAASGKTTLCRRLSREFDIPAFSRDDFKEPMYDHFGFPDLPMHRVMGALAHAHLDRVTEELLDHGVSVLVDAPFDSSIYTRVVQAMQQRVSFHVLRIQLECKGEVLTERFLARARSADHHPGHQALTYFSAMKAKLAIGTLPPIDIEGPLLEIDTTTWPTDFGPVSDFLRGHLRPAPER